MIYPQHDQVSKITQSCHPRLNVLFDLISVTRVQPRTSKGITDLLLPHSSPSCNYLIVPLRSSATEPNRQ
jgi:hypothetical protein